MNFLQRTSLYAKTTIKNWLTSQKTRRVAVAGALTVFGIAGLHRWTGFSTSTTMAQNINVPLPTMGGAQLWTDHLHRRGYRIQQNALTKHWRLLDPKNVRRAWGSRSDVQTALDAIEPAAPAPSDRPVVVLLHGLMRTDHCMKSLESQFHDAGFDQTIRFGYASTRGSLAESATALREVLESQSPEAEFAFVGHSMGNIVTRHLIGDLQANGDPKNLLPRFRSMVMLGPPNHGAAIARRLGPTGVFGLVAGPGAMELGSRWVEVESKLATPDFPFAIVAGNVKTPVANPLVDGKGDFVVSLEEAKLNGAETVHEVPVLHSFLMDEPDVQSWTIHFVEQH
ncbi:lipase [Rhodopirellula sp. JC740]|uniref:Lipase n=1 Tax=Rhodopirellula halodulae TaxID=2894198 RepID=A0ABS8NMU9_9BACT|nr:lipase [Rhodopirellula sp. JC740]MCC9644867.1 lipase [Rhodopirellula sp. JC740]